MDRVHTIVCALLIVLGATGCGSINLLTALDPSPHERYLETLRRAGLDRTALGQDWTRWSQESLQKAVTIAPPFQETGYFPPDEATAVAYRMDLRRGRRLSVTVTFDSTQPGALFVDLFRVSTTDPPRRVASLDSISSTLSYDVERDGEYILRIQPEVLRGGRFTLIERTLASLMFPVSGLSARAIQSGFGSTRDAGARAHEGVDIFAPRGTPVLAVSSGIARPSTNALGGNVVWLRGEDETSYYAHLDRQALSGVTPVKAGDVLGYVGNTGNARATAPHLHFGLYDNGAIDPLPFLQADDPAPLEPTTEFDYLDELVRVVPARTAVRAGAASNAPTRALVERGSIARVSGVSGSWARVTLPDAVTGYIAASALTFAVKPLRQERLASKSALLEVPSATSPVIEVIDANARVDVLGTSGGYQLLRAPSGRLGWASVSSTRQSAS
jgi:murein DD-endopeptidase MepM/ murein hydrolase activator NlpD